MKFFNDTIAFTAETDEIPFGFRPLTELPLVIVVGLTGVGKSTVLELLAQNGLIFTLLPNRREITDQIIIASLQTEAGETLRPIKDRVQRFEYTARYRTKYAGGMAHALRQMVVEPNQARSLLIFDGLRGLDEIRFAVEYFPKAHFLILDAPDTVRLNRLLQRGDLFDAVDMAGSGLSAGQNIIPSWTSESAMATLSIIPQIETVFSQEQLQQMVAAVQATQIPVDEIAQKVSIIVKERHNYDSGRAKDYLIQVLPQQRVLVVDTSVYPADKVAEKAAEWLTTCWRTSVV